MNLAMQVGAVFLATVLVFGCDDDKKTVAPAVSATASVVPSAASSASTSASAASSDNPETITAQHILVAYKGAKGATGATIRTKAEAKKRADDILVKAKAGEDFSQLAQQFSDDLGSRDRQGNLGKFSRDKMTPAFAVVAFGLAVNQISDVVETPFGFHIIKRNQ